MLISRIKNVRSIGWPLASLVLLWAMASAARAEETIHFKATPPNVKQVGRPGGRVGWGYVLQNNSRLYWLVPKNLNFGSFQFGHPSAIFDFPTLQPGAGSPWPTIPLDQPAFSDFIGMSRLLRDRERRRSCHGLRVVV